MPKEITVAEGGEDCVAAELGLGLAARPRREHRHPVFLRCTTRSMAEGELRAGASIPSDARAHRRNRLA